MSAFSEWWKLQLDRGESVANPEEMLAAMIEAFEDVAQMGFNAGLEAAAKVCEKAGYADTPPHQLRDAIRSLKDKPS